MDRQDALGIRKKAAEKCYQKTHQGTSQVSARKGQTYNANF